MKMIAMLAGELSISARYFLPFANVSKDDCTNLKGTFGVGRGHTWEPQKIFIFEAVQQKQIQSKITDFH